MFNQHSVVIQSFTGYIWLHANTSREFYSIWLFVCSSIRIFYPLPAYYLRRYIQTCTISHSELIVLKSAERMHLIVRQSLVVCQVSVVGVLRMSLSKVSSTSELMINPCLDAAFCPTISHERKMTQPWVMCHKMPNDVFFSRLHRCMSSAFWVYMLWMRNANAFGAPQCHENPAEFVYLKIYCIYRPFLALR